LDSFSFNFSFSFIESTDPGAGDAPEDVDWIWMADEDGPNGMFVDDRRKDKKNRRHTSTLHLTRHPQKLKI
jgi:hypothetical protein